MWVPYYIHGFLITIEEDRNSEGFGEPQRRLVAWSKLGGSQVDCGELGQNLEVRLECGLARERW